MNTKKLIASILFCAILFTGVPLSTASAATVSKTNTNVLSTTGSITSKTVFQNRNNFRIERYDFFGKLVETKYTWDNTPTHPYINYYESDGNNCSWSGTLNLINMTEVLYETNTNNQPLYTEYIYRITYKYKGTVNKICSK